MKNFFIIAIVIPILLPGCAPTVDPSKHEAYFKGIVKSDNDLADALESIKDQSTARLAAPTIEKICDDIEKQTTAAMQLPRIRFAVKDKLIKQNELQKAHARVNKAIPEAEFKANGEPNLNAAIQKLRDTFSKMQPYFNE